MCGGGKAARAAADAAAREQQRQAEIERARLAEEARIAKEEADRRYAEQAERDQARLAEERANAELLRRQIADQEAFRLSEMARIEAARKAERDADLARQAAERTAAEQAAAGRATQLATYNTNRQGLIDSARGRIEAAFGQYNDDYYNRYASDYVAAAKPQIERQYDDAKRATTFNFARRGNLQSSAAGRAFGRLDETRADAEANVAQEAQSAASRFRSTVDGQRSQLLNSIFGAVSAAPVITADNVGEANNALSYITNALAAPVSLAGSTSKIAPPSFGQIGSIFSTQQSSPGVPRSGYNTGGGIPSSSGSSGRLVQ